MNRVFILIGSLVLASCSQHDSQIEFLQNRIDSLESNQAKMYKPGLGEFMSGIQMHHAKLWFAGTTGNWPLADFELGEIRESIEDIKKYENDRKEVKTIDMIDPPLAGIDSAVKQKNISAFKANFVLLTNTCNSCHQTNGFGFNAIKVPDAVPVPNQVFTPVK
jgi:hypothetical protein